MNLFSQSKLTLKLKKQNNIIPADSSKKCQNTDSSKSESLSNYSIVSESDSFIEILHNVPSHEENISTSQSVFKTPPLEQKAHDKIIEKKQCPVCLQIVDDKNFITHVKSCGTSHNLPSELLIKAVDLQERQAAEREALGLPKITKNQDLKKKKQNTNKQTKLKNGKDCNLDLAIAMSVSLQESKEAEILKESETLLEAGLENEAMEKRKTLESFGFISNQPVKSKSKNFSKTNAALFKQTKEGREKRITEKVAIILIDPDTDASVSETLVSHDSTSKLESKHLNKIRNLDNKLWKKSLLDDENVNEFYVNNLSKFFKPCENNIIVESNTNNKELVDTLHEVIDNPNLDNAPIISNNIIKKNTMSEYSSKWKLMVDNQLMSDITIFAKDEREIPAHSIVLHVQCPGILEDIITEESNTNKSKQMLMWLEYSYEACLAFLELIYSGQESLIKTEYRDDYLNLATRYNILIAITDDENHGWFSENHEPSKRKSQELLDNPTNCKRYKASSPDMFMESDICGEYKNTNFLETTVVNDEKSLSILKTKQWLNDCNSSHQIQSSFKENLTIDIPFQTILPEKSPSHSFHSASTVCIQFSPASSCNEYQMASEHLSPKSSSENSIIILDETINVLKASTPLARISKFTSSCKEPELIILNSDSDTESLNMILPNTMKTSYNNNRFKNTNLLNRNFPISSQVNASSSFNTKSENSIQKITIELNDNSLDSVHSASTNILPHQKSHIAKSSCSLFRDPSISHLRNQTIVQTDDDNSVFSATTNVLPNNNLKMQMLTSNYPHGIDLVEDGTDSSKSFSNLMSFIKNPTSFKQEHFKTNEDYHLNSESLPSNRVLFECFQHDNISNTTNCINGNYVKQNEDTKSKIFFDKKIGLNKPSSDSELLENISKNKNVILHSNNHNNPLTNLAVVTNLTSCMSNEFINEHTPINSIHIQDKPIQQSEFNIPCEETHSKEKYYEKDKSNFDQIFDDPFIDYNDWQSINISPECVSPVLSNSVQLNESEIKTQKDKNDQLLDLDLETSISTNPNDSNPNDQKQNSVTPNKYGSRICTPKSLRRIRSESVIGSKEQITPLPDYSSMKTPVLRKEFDRYGLKDLGRRKGKLILRHIYDELHSIHNPEKSKHNNIDAENCSDSSDSSVHGIADYEIGNYAELETLSQVNTSNKITVEMGFKQLLQVNENLHQKILCYEPIWIEDLKEDLKQFNVNISMQKLTTFLDERCITFRSKTLNDQRQKTLAKKNIKRKKLF